MKKVCALTHLRVTCAFIKTHNYFFLTKIMVDRDLKGHPFYIKNTARHFVMEVWLVVGSMLKLLHVEIASL